MGRLGRYENVRRLKNMKMQLLRNLLHSNGLGFPRKFLIISPHSNFEVNKLSLKMRYVFQTTVLTIFRYKAVDWILKYFNFCDFIVLVFTPINHPVLKWREWEIYLHDFKAIHVFWINSLQSFKWYALTDIIGKHMLFLVEYSEVPIGCNTDYTRKNVTTCSKSANKLSKCCVRTACYKMSTSLEQAVNNL